MQDQIQLYQLKDLQVEILRNSQKLEDKHINLKTRKFPQLRMYQSHIRLRIQLLKSQHTPQCHNHQLQLPNSITSDQLQVIGMKTRKMH